MERNSPAPGSKTQQRKQFYRAARKYARQYLARFNPDPDFSEKKLRLATRNLAETACNLTPSERTQQSATAGAPAGKPPIVHLLGAGHGYRQDRTPENLNRLTARAVDWYLSEQRKEQTTQGAAIYHANSKHRRQPAGSREASLAPPGTATV